MRLTDLFLSLALATAAALAGCAGDEPTAAQEPCDDIVDGWIRSDPDEADGSLNRLWNIEHARTISPVPEFDAMRNLTQIQLVERAYLRIYTDDLSPDDVRDFKRDFPLDAYVEPASFARTTQTILPPDFFREAGLSQAVVRELLDSRLQDRWGDARERTGKRWIDKGHDTPWVWRAVVDAHIRANDWQAAMSLAVRELGARDVKRVEDQRIAFLREQGKWLVIELPDGRRERVFPTWDERS